MRVTIPACSGIGSGQKGRVIPWTDKRAQPMLNDYPFVGGRTPQSMGWIAVLLDSGEVSCYPKNRLFKARHN